MSTTASRVNARAGRKPPSFNLREFRRLFKVCCGYPGPLALGLVSTIIFAGLHTVSIAASLPVFKILLEEETPQAWADRTIAYDRTGLNLVVTEDQAGAKVFAVPENSRAYEAGIRADQVLRDAGGQTGAALVHALANGPDGVPVAVVIADNGKESQVSLIRGPRSIENELLSRAAVLLPSGAEQDKLKTLGYMLIGLVVIIVLGNVFRYVGEVLIAKSVLRSMMDLRGRVYEHTLHLPMTYFANQPTSDLVGRFVQDIQEIQRGMLTLFSKFIREPLRALFILGLAVCLDWRLTVAVLVVAPIVAFVFWGVGSRVKKANRKLLQAYGEMIGALTASLQNLKVVKAYTAEEIERQRLRAVDARVLKQQLKLAKLQAFVSPAMEIVAVLAGSLLTIWLASRVLKHELPASQFVTLGITLSMLFDPLRKLSDVFVRVQRSTAGAERIFQVVDHAIESDGSRSDTDVKPLAERIEFRGVNFTYPGADQPALVDVNLMIERGETVAIVGPNGCGKTTLVSMLPRLYEPDSGSIHYDGLDLRHATLKSLRSQIGLVTQDAVVFAGTPGENIAYGSGEVDLARAAHAAKQASADEFIEALPGGIEGNLGERGTTLSGGQRQRLAIARAIFRDAPILIFDEATSQIDSESELKIQTALQEFSRNRTTLIIAHRLSTIQFADRIIVMDGGRVLDSGAHEALIKRCDLYRTLCDTQFGTASSDG